MEKKKKPFSKKEKKIILTFKTSNPYYIYTSWIDALYKLTFCIHVVKWQAGGSQQTLGYAPPCFLSWTMESLTFLIVEITHSAGSNVNEGLFGSFFERKQSWWEGWQQVAPESLLAFWWTRKQKDVNTKPLLLPIVFDAKLNSLDTALHNQCEVIS